MIRIALIVLTLLTLSTATATAQVNGADRYGCDDLADYAMAIYTALPADDLERLMELAEIDIDRMRPSQLREASQLLDDWATAVEAIPARDVPKAARDYHEAFIESLSLMSTVYSAVASGNIFSLVAYTETMEELTVELDAAQATGARRCPADWPFDAVMGGVA